MKKITLENNFYFLSIFILALFFSLSYSFDTNGLIGGTVQSGILKFPDGPSSSYVVHTNSWSIIVQIISFLVRINISAVAISQIIIFFSTLVFLIAIFLTCKFLTNSSILGLLVSFIVILLKKNFGHLDYPTIIFSEHTGGLMSQALSTLVFGLFINNNFKLGFFFSAILLCVHPIIGLWLNFIIFSTILLKFKIDEIIIFFKENLTSVLLGLLVVLFSFFIFYRNSVPINYSYDDETFRTYMSVWDAHRTAYGQHDNIINFKYIYKSLGLVLLILIFLKLQINNDKFQFGIRLVLLHCLLSLCVYFAYKYFYHYFPDIVIRVMPTRFLLLHSVIGWPIIFSIIYIIFKSFFIEKKLNLKYLHYFFITIIIVNILQHNSNISERYNALKINFSKPQLSKNQFWHKVRDIDSDGYYLTSTDVCVKTIAISQKPLLMCPESIDYIPYFPSIATPLKKIIEEVFAIPFDDPKIKNFGGIHPKEVRLSYETKTKLQWKEAAQNFNLVGLIVPNDWKIDLVVYLSGEKYNLYIIK
tara:strand:+ start:194 stop:1783 length:1590 start_codon:yes stop_codon:yes gene_type:complete